MSASNATNYDPIAEIYLVSTDKNPFTTYYERPFIIDNLTPLNGNNVLDLGCATGYFSKYCFNKGADCCEFQISIKTDR